jgi:uncharacterized membrane protein YeiH
MLYYWDILGTAVFATTGALAANKKKLDIFGYTVLGLVTALGGGTFRDISLGITPVFWVKSPSYILTAILFSILTFFLFKIYNRIPKMLQTLDAMGLGIFTIIGTQKTLLLGYSVTIAVVMGVTTGILGGIIRDTLSGQIPFVLRKEIYATASLLGAIIFIGLNSILNVQFLIIFPSVILVISTRLIALQFGLSLPRITNTYKN